MSAALVDRSQPPRLDADCPTQSPHVRRVVDYFDRTAADYRRLWGVDRHLGLHCGFADADHRGHDAGVLNMNRVLAESVGVTAADCVLDAGCGIGGSAVWLARHRGCRVTGVNVQPRQLETARRVVQSRGLAALVRLVEADFARTGLAGASFDVVWALESQCYAESKPAFLAEAARLLKPGGRLVVADVFLTRSDLDPVEREIVARFETGWALPPTPTFDAYRAWLGDAGFREIETRDVTANVDPSSRRIFRVSRVAAPLCRLLAALRLLDPSRAAGIRSGYYQRLALVRGLGRYRIVTAKKA